MPLTIPSRPPNPFFNQQRRRILPTIVKQEDESVKHDDSEHFKLYPLESESPPNNAPAGRRAVPVAPLPHARPQPRKSQNMLGQHQPIVPQGQPHHGATRGSHPHMPPQGRHNASAGQPGFSMAAPTMPRPNHIDPMPINDHMPISNHMQTPAVSSNQQQSSPEQAVKQFRRANQGLPDGVRYEPLDETTMRLLRENGHLPPAPEPPSSATSTVPSAMPSATPSAMPSPVIMPPATPQLPIMAEQLSPQPQATPPVTLAPQGEAPHSAHEQQSIISIVEGLVQDERNAQIFYSHFALSTENRVIATALDEIANDCHRHTQQLTGMLTNQFGVGFVPIEAEINTVVDLQGALTLALMEENKTLRALAELLDTINNSDAEKIIQRIINKKIVNYNQLIRFRASD